MSNAVVPSQLSYSQQDLLDFIRSIDDNTEPSDSEMDTFLEAHPVVR